MTSSPGTIPTTFYWHSFTPPWVATLAGLETASLELHAPFKQGGPHAFRDNKFNAWGSGRSVAVVVATVSVLITLVVFVFAVVVVVVQMMQKQAD